MTSIQAGTKQKSLISSSRAAQLSGYSQDYVGQLCRNGSVECKRVLGEWKVSLPTILAYKKRFNPDFNVISEIGTSNEVINDAINTKQVGHKDVFTKDGKEYISSADAAVLTGYSQDYIGQLARSEAILAHKEGRKWFIEEKSLKEHKTHNDGLLAALQVKSVGISDVPSRNQSVTTSSVNRVPIVTYKRDDGSDLPGTTAVDDIGYVHPKVTNGIKINNLHNGENGRTDLINKDKMSILDNQTLVNNHASKANKKAVNSRVTYNEFSKNVIPFLVSIFSVLFIIVSYLYPVLVHVYIIKLPYMATVVDNTVNIEALKYVLNIFDGVSTYEL